MNGILADSFDHKLFETKHDDKIMDSSNQKA